MHNPGRVVKVVDGLNHLGKVIARVALREASSFILLLNEREEIALFDEFEDDEKYLDSAARRRTHHNLPIDVPIEQVNNIGMLDVLEEAYFVVQNFLKGRQ